MKTCGQCKKYEAVFDWLGQCQAPVPAFLKSLWKTRYVHPDEEIADECKCFAPREEQEKTDG